jgi:N-methylhydantoinase A
MLQTALRHEVTRSVLGAGAMPEDAAIAALFGTLAAAARTELEIWQAGAARVTLAADLRYGEQVFEITVPLEGVPLTAEGLRQAFHARHRALFTYDLPGEEVVLVTARAAAEAVGEAPPAQPVPARDDAAPLATRRARLAAGWAELPVFDFAALAAGQRIQGPAIVESATTTVLLLEGDAGVMDARGWLDVALPGYSAASGG